MNPRHAARRSRPPSNRRLKRGQKVRDQWHVLDVATQSTKERRHRRRNQTRLLLKVAGLSILLVATAAGGKSVIGRALYGRDASGAAGGGVRPAGDVPAADGIGGVRLATIAVRTNGSLTRARILKEAGVEEGHNLLKIDLDAVRSALVAMPQVAAADVSRELPDKLSITIDERIPLAWLSCPLNGVHALTSQDGFLLDTAGHIFRCESLLREYMALPIIHVGGACRIKDGAKGDSEAMRAAIEILRLTRERMPRGVWEVKEVEVVSEFALRARFHNDAEIIFGVRDLERQFDDFRTVSDYAASVDKHLATLNLLVERNIPATFFDFQQRDLDSLRPEGQAQLPIPSEPARSVPTDRRTQQVRGILGGT